MARPTGDLQSRAQMLRSGSVLLLLLACTPPVAAQEMPATQAVRVNGALALDGTLDDPAWKDFSQVEADEQLYIVYSRTGGTLEAPVGCRTTAWS